MKTVRRSIHPTATISLLMAICMWSTMPLFLRSFIHEIDGWVANGVRYPFAALLWIGPLTILACRGQVERRVFRLALVPSLVNLVGQSLWAWAPYFLEPAMMMFLARLTIVYAVLGSFLLFPDERRLGRSLFFWLGLGCCLGGFVGMNLFRTQPWSHASWVGLGIILFQSLFMASYGISVRYYMRGIRPWVSFPVICIYTSIGLLPMMFGLGEPARLLVMPATRLLVLVLSSLLGIALGHVFYYYAIEHLGVAISSSCSLASPFLTAIGSYWIYTERLSGRQWMFGVLMLGGVGFLLREQQKLGEPKEGAAACQIPELEEFASSPENIETLPSR